MLYGFDKSTPAIMKADACLSPFCSVNYLTHGTAEKSVKMTLT